MATTTNINANTRNVVIVGGGGAGQSLARMLSEKLNASEFSIIVIEPRPYHLLLPPSLRMVVSAQDKLEDQILVPYDKTFINGNGSVLQGKVSSIHKSPSGKGGHITLESGDEVKFEVLILSTGNIWHGPIAFPDSAAEVSSFVAESRQRFSKAQNIVLAGGGAVGIELAGEIKDVWPDKKVTIVHSQKLLLNTVYPDKFRKALSASVHSRGIDLILDDFLDETPEYTGAPHLLTTRNGTKLETDYVINTRGPTPNTKFIGESLGPDVLTLTGHLKVKPTLQLQSDESIFAMGDIIDWNEQKQIVKAYAHAGVVAANVAAYLSGQPVATVYKGSLELIFVTNGKGGGSGYAPILWGLVLPGWLVSALKSKGLFIGKTRSMHGY